MSEEEALNSTWLIDLEPQFKEQTHSIISFETVF